MKTFKIYVSKSFASEYCMACNYLIRHLEGVELIHASPSLGIYYIEATEEAAGTLEQFAAADMFDIEEWTPQYVRFIYDTPYAGTREEEYVLFLNTQSERQLRFWATTGAEDNATMCEYVVEEEIDWEDMDEDEINSLYSSYYEGIYGEYEIITKEEWKENDGYIKKER